MDLDEIKLPAWVTDDLIRNLPAWEAISASAVVGSFEELEDLAAEVMTALEKKELFEDLELASLLADIIYIPQIDKHMLVLTGYTEARVVVEKHLAESLAKFTKWKGIAAHEDRFKLSFLKLEIKKLTVPATEDLQEDEFQTSKKYYGHTRSLDVNGELKPYKESKTS